MRISTIVLVISLLHISAFALGQRVTIQKKNMGLKSVFTEIRKQTGYTVLVQSDQINKSETISLNLKNVVLHEAMTKILENKNLSFKIEDKSIIIFTTKKPLAETANVARQIINIKGKVIDASGQSISGVTITVKGTDHTTSTDNTGSFSISASINDVLQIKMLGFDSQEIKISSSDFINVTLVASSTDLDQVVVTALGIKRDEKSLGYAVQKIQGNTLTEVKGVNIATSMTGKVAGLNIRNSTEFAANPTIQLRGENALLVIDGVPYVGMSLDNISPDDIAHISVLKGSTATALYGVRGSGGAIMITTKKGNKEGGLVVSFNSSNLFSAGFVAFPKVQTSYSSGAGGKYAVGDYVWGDKLDIERKANQYNPDSTKFISMDLISKGRNNLKNFLQQGFITNNNLNVTHTGENGSLRASITHVYNKGQYPNSKLNKIIGSLSGEMKVGNFNLDGGFTFNKRFFPNNVGAGYGGGGYMYNLVIWSGSEYDVREYKNYWVKDKENVMQNWMENNWYDNPYFIANEILSGNNYNMTTGYINASYKINPWLKATLRSGVDNWDQIETQRNAISAVGGWNKKGHYGIIRSNAFSMNNDLMLSSSNKIGDLSIESLLGFSLVYTDKRYLKAETQNGLTVPGFYSLNASADPVKVTPYTNFSNRDSQIGKKQINSTYAKASLSYKNFAYLDLTGRYDIVSTLSADERAYFYPSASGSFVFSELINLPSWINMARVRGSWTQSKKDAEIYAINPNYTINPNVWNGASSSNYPTTIRSGNILPETDRTYEYGAAFIFLNNRIQLDVAYFNRLYYNKIVSSPVSRMSGFNEALINSQEEWVRKGIEIAASGTIINKNNFTWVAGINWSTNKMYYAKLDPVYTEDKEWIKVGERKDASINKRYDYTPDGKIITQNGIPILNPKDVVIGYTDPNWIYGLNNSFRYKNFNVGVSIDGRVGGISYNNMEGYMWSSGAHIDSDNF